MGEFSNTVRISGKVSRVGPLKYTPGGKPLGEITVAVPQSYLGKSSMGNMEVLLEGDLAEVQSQDLKIGQVVEIMGSLWTRSFKDKRGSKVVETKVLAAKLTRKK